MKRTLAIAALGALLFGVSFTTPAAAQDKGKGQGAQTGNRGQIRPNFVDLNGDGICDNNTGGTCTGAGTGTGTGDRKRLRDGSCGLTPRPEGSSNRQFRGNSTK